MKELLFLLLLTNPFFWEVSECGCDPTSDLSIRQLIEGDLIFKGQMVDKRTEYFPEIGYNYVATFTIDELITGEVESNTVDINFGYGDTFCSIDFQPLFSYLIVANKMEGFPLYQTGFCSGNKRWENLSKEDNRLLFNFQNGTKELEWRNNFDQVYAKGRLVEKKPVGQWQFFSWNMNLIEFGNYLDGKKQGDWITLYNSVTICFELNLPFLGPSCDLSKVVPPHPAGWISSLTPYRNGKIEGAVLTFKESGCIDSEAYYEKGRLYGSVIKY